MGKLPRDIRDMTLFGLEDYLKQSDIDLTPIAEYWKYCFNILKSGSQLSVSDGTKLLILLTNTISWLSEEGTYVTGEASSSTK